MITTRVKILAGILGFSVVFLIFDTVQRSSDKKEPSAPPVKSSTETATATTPRPDAGIQRRAAPSSPRVLASAVNPTEGWGRNPFVRSGSDEKASQLAESIAERGSSAPLQQTFTIPELKVRAITYSSGQARALINGRILRVGDVIEGMLIMEINEAAVTLRGGGRTLTLEVGT